MKNVEKNRMKKQKRSQGSRFEVDEYKMMNSW